MNSIEILVKPDWVSWEEIHDVLWKSHAQNREDGIAMGHQNLTGEGIRDLLGDYGTMFVAIIDGRVVGTAAVIIKETNFWFGKDNYAYCCFASVLPEFEGQGIYRRFVIERENYALRKGIDKIYFNTHPRNKKVIHIAEKSGYKKVRYTTNNCFSYVFLVKWLNGCPYSDIKCRLEYIKCKLFAIIKNWVKSIIGKNVAL